MSETASCFLHGDFDAVLRRCPKCGAGQGSDTTGAAARNSRPTSTAERAREIYEAAVRYLVANGWRREELGSGWWWKDSAREEATLGSALEAQLEADGLDQRVAIPGEPEEFWG